MAVSVTHWTIATFILRLEEEDSVIRGMLRGSWGLRDLLTYASPACCGGPRIVFGWRGVRFARQNRVLLFASHDHPTHQRSGVPNTLFPVDTGVEKSLFFALVIARVPL